MYWLRATAWAVIGIVWARDAGSLLVCGGMIVLHIRWAMQKMDLEEEERKRSCGSGS